MSSYVPLKSLVTHKNYETLNYLYDIKILLCFKIMSITLIHLLKTQHVTCGPYELSGEDNKLSSQSMRPNSIS